jgi:hypothetical protein
MAAFKVPLKIDQGATFRKSATWKVGPAPGTAVDLTGCTARMHIRSDVKSPLVLATLTTANGGITLGGVAGTVEIYISDEATTLFAWTTGVYDLEVEFANGDVRRLMYGSVTVSPEVTRG